MDSRDAPKPVVGLTAPNALAVVDDPNAPVVGAEVLA